MSSTEKGCGRGSFVQHTRPAPEETRSGRGPHPSPAIKSSPAVLCDFDDTTAVENVAELLLKHFSHDTAWQQLREQSQEKIISFKEYQERAFNSTGASREAMTALVRAQATFRPYFKELWRYCQTRSLPLAIVSAGLDFYVDALLEREGLEEIPRYTVKTRFTSEGISYEYPHTWDGWGGSTEDVCRQWGNCKCSVLGEYRRKGHSILYVGDGRSDFCPASVADQVFARGQLVQLCQETPVPYTEFGDFRDVIQWLESSGAGAIGTEAWADRRQQEVVE